MKKRFMKSTVLALSVSLFAALPLGVQAESSNSLLNAGYMLNEKDSIEVYNDIVDELDSEEYGGMFLDDKGKLNIYVTPDDLREDSTKEETLETIEESMVSDDQEIILKEAKYTMEELEELQEVLTEYMGEYDILSISIDEFHNKLELTALEWSEEFKKDITDIAGENAKCIKFAITEEEPERDATEIQSGMEFSTNKALFSVACGVKWTSGSTTKYGYLTAGHCGKAGETVYYKNTNKKIGKFSKSKFSGSMDAALIEATDRTNFKSTNWCKGGEKSGTFAGIGTSKRPVGAQVIKYGRTTGRTTGKVKSTSATVNYTADKVTLKNMISATYSHSAGDSGGAIVSFYGATGATNKVIGVHSGGNSSTSYYTPMLTIKEAWGISVNIQKRYDIPMSLERIP